MSERRMTDIKLWFVSYLLTGVLIALVAAGWKHVQPTPPTCRDEVRVVPLNVPSLCAQNQHRVVVVPLTQGAADHSMIVHCACSQNTEVVHVFR